MKGRYGKGHMMIYGHILPGAASIASSGFWEDKLTEQAKHRLRVVGWHKKNEENISLTARHFGYTRKTIRKWMLQYKQSGPGGLNDKSKAPNKRPVPQTSSNTIMHICNIRKRYPAWSKCKIAEILR